MTLEEYRNAITGRPDNYAYFGDKDLEVWGTIIAQTRDSDALERSNFAVISEDVIGRFGDEGAQIEGSSHWAVGWIDELRINTDNPDVLEAAYEWHCKLDDYPIADEEHYSQVEMEDVEEAYNSYGKDDVIEWLRENGDPLGLLDEDAEPLEDREHYLFRLFSDCLSYNGEAYVDDDAMEYAMGDVRYEMRAEFEQ